MLVLTRREGEVVVVQDELRRFPDFEIIVTRLQGDRVRIGFEKADETIRFLRKELLEPTNHGHCSSSDPARS